MMKTITTHEAKTHLSRYLAEAEKGESFIIMRGKQAVAKLTPLRGEVVRRRPKLGESEDSRVQIPDEAFAPLTAEELKEWGL